MSQIKQIFSNKASLKLHPLVAEPAFSTLIPIPDGDYLPSYQINTELWDATEWGSLVEWLKSHPEVETTFHCFCGTQKVADDAWDFVYSRFEIMEAAGGIVENKQNQLLLIFRKGHWDLPKGKLDSGETIDQCALREVEEETGVHSLEIQDFLDITYHIYPLKGDWILKESYWYKMSTSFVGELQPQLEEEITQVVWVEKSQWKSHASEMYPLIRELLSVRY